jgi:hypothetical protein
MIIQIRNKLCVVYKCFDNFLWYKIITNRSINSIFIEFFKEIIKCYISTNNIMTRVISEGVGGGHRGHGPLQLI